MTYSGMITATDLAEVLDEEFGVWGFQRYIVLLGLDPDDNYTYDDLDTYLCNFNDECQVGMDYSDINDALDIAFGRYG